MTPIIRHLSEIFPELFLNQAAQNPANWSFSESIKGLGPEFYRKIVPLHLLLNLEYSLLGQQLQSRFISKKPIDEEELTEQLIAALMLAELLEHIYEHYLIIPREVRGLRRQQSLYRELLAKLGKSFPKKPEHEPDDFSFTQEIRNLTFEINLFRLLFTRSKRALDFIALISKSDAYLKFVRIMDGVLDPFIAHLGWIFFIPRLAVNLFVIIKHTVGGLWMEKEESSLGWTVRFNTQIKRRWFELGNDLIWISTGLINCFYLTGVLAPFAFYVSLVAFALDVVLSITRTYIELSRLFELREYYTNMLDKADDLKEQKAIRKHIEAIDKQIAFEQFRLGSHIATTTLIFMSICCALPIFAVNPIIPVAGAICLALICVINFALTEMINDSRPKDTIDRTTALCKLGFFSDKEPPPIKLQPMSTEEDDMELDQSLCCL
ncbi:hypothetical protein OQJ14_12400 [Fluoribacter dumoffii]|uniref:hypothetical protein n=1 Tax=Fluoribacter dumoffii TaxID=463 RepID=UPI0022438061|nr:hypothetical protein [Fluoribacter dumoffii]MCW8484160.1 hypothetical protein [Fluoribacter dumoffii]